MIWITLYSIGQAARKTSSLSYCQNTEVTLQSGFYNIHNIVAVASV